MNVLNRIPGVSGPQKPLAVTGRCLQARRASQELLLGSLLSAGEVLRTAGNGTGLRSEKTRLPHLEVRGDQAPSILSRPPAPLRLDWGFTREQEKKRLLPALPRKGEAGNISGKVPGIEGTRGKFADRTSHLQMPVCQTFTHN